MTTVKICGITNLDDACTAVEAGADLLGLIFYPKSPRYVTVETAAFIAGAVQDAYGERAPRLVGVFVDEPADRIQALLDATGLHLAQLHGREPPAVVRRLAPRAYKAIRPHTQEQAQAALDTYRDTVPDDPRLPDLLVDAYHPEKLGGTGHTADPRLAQWLAPRVRLLLAGGLTPDNVGSAVLEIRPWGVDVSSGVELRPGTKDPARVRAFIQAVRAADKALAPSPGSTPTPAGASDKHPPPRSRERQSRGPGPAHTPARARDAVSGRAMEKQLPPRSRETVSRGPSPAHTPARARDTVSGGAMEKQLPPRSRETVSRGLGNVEKRTR